MQATLYSNLTGGPPTPSLPPILSSYQHLLSEIQTALHFIPCLLFSLAAPSVMPGRKARPFSPAEEALLIDLKENQELAWSEIGVAFCRVFPKRTAGALQVHYCRKLHLRRDRRRRPQQDRSETNEHDDDEEEEDDGDGEDLNGTHSQTSSSTAGRVTRSALARAVKRQRIVEQDDDQSDPSDDSMLDASYFNSRISSDAKSSRRTLASSRPKSSESRSEALSRFHKRQLAIITSD